MSREAGLVVALGVGQIIAWGTLIYGIAILGTPMAAELAIERDTLFAAFSIGLGASGLTSPAAGRWIDRAGGRGAMSLGSVLAALAFALMAVATNAPTLFAAWVIGGVAMSLGLYDAAFATLARAVPDNHRRAVTSLTLLGALASTVFWPLTQWLLDRYGWRGALGVHAGLHLLVCLPIHAGLIPRYAAPVRAATSTVTDAGVAHVVPAGFRLLAAAFAFGQFITSAIAVHVITLLTAGGLAIGQAVWIAALIGPMQLIGRVVELSVARRVSSRAVARTTFLLMVTAVVLLLATGGSFAIAAVFVMLYGWANGTMTIVRGTLPAELYGRERYGELLGRMARPAFLSRAIAPFAVALVLTDFGRTAGVAALIVAALCAYAGFEAAAARIARIAGKPAAPRPSDDHPR